jgi:MFS family permease
MRMFARCHVCPLPWLIGARYILSTITPRDSAMNRSLLLPLLGWASGAIFFFYAWVLRVSPSVMIDELMRDFHVSSTLLGNLSAFYFYGYAGMQIPVGLMLDRYGPRRLMTLAALICALACVLCAVSSSFWTMAAGRFLIGASAAFSLVGSMAVAGQWFPAHRFALLGGMATFMGMAGGVLGQAPVRFGVEAYGWRAVMFAFACGGLLIAAMAWATVRDHQRQGGNVGQIFKGLMQVAQQPQTWLISVVGLGAGAPLLGFAALWGVPYLGVTHGLDKTTAAAVTSMMFVGWGLAAPVNGWLSDRLASRQIPLVAGLLVSAYCISAIVYVPGMPVSVVAALCLLGGIGGSVQTIGFATAREHNPVHLSGTTIGFVNCLMTGSGAVFQTLIGWLLDYGWTGQMVAGARAYDAATYRFALTAIVAGPIIGCLAALAIRETHCKQVG